MSVSFRVFGKANLPCTTFGYIVFILEIMADFDDTIE